MRLIPCKGGDLRRKFVLLSPRRSHSSFFCDSGVDASLHRQLLADAQRLRGSVYLQIGATESSQLSSDGRYLVGFVGGEKSTMMVFDVQTRRWKTVAHGNNFYHLRKASDGKYFYFQEIPSPGEPLFRMHVGDWKVERVMSFESILQGNVVRCRFAEVMPDGSPIVIAVRGGYEIYSLDLELP